MTRIARLCASLLLLSLLVSPGGCARAQDDGFRAARLAMVEGIERQALAAGETTGAPRLDPPVLEAMRRVPRHAFVPPDLLPAAYLDTPLPVLPGATVSQPFIVALMLHLAGLEAGEEALVVGVGAGYLTALLAEMDLGVRAMEYDEEIAAYAGGVFEDLGLDAIELRIGDGYYGWPERGRRFDAIVVRLAIPEVPATLTAQLAPGGRLIAPVGQPDGRQWLTVVERDEEGRLQERRVLEVRFTPLPGGIRI